MKTEDRRAKLQARLVVADRALTGTELAKEFKVSRQIIVGDINILRAQGVNVFATARGYLIPKEESADGDMMATLICRHDAEGMRRELEIIVDNGGRVRDVIVEHPVYGEIRGDLVIRSRRDVKAFLDKMEALGASPLLSMSGGVHLHTIEVPDKEALEEIRRALEKEKILVE